MTRRKTKKVKVGRIAIGGRFPDIRSIYDQYGYSGC